MAKVTRGIIVEPVALEKGIILKLTNYEAGVLANILSGVGGDPKGPRGVVDEILIEFHQIGVPRDLSPYKGTLILL